MKKSILTIIALGMCSAAFAGNGITLPAESANTLTPIVLDQANTPTQRTAELRRQRRVLADNPYVARNAMSLGGDLLYGSEIESLGIGLKFTWMISNSFQLAPNATFWIKNDGLSSWDINLDVRYMIPLAARWRLYPLAGLTLSYWNQQADWERNLEKDSSTNFGLNLGAGIEFDINPRWYINLDFKYRIVSTYDQATAGLGFGYRF